MIVKVQVSLAGAPAVLVYTEDHAYYAQLPLKKCPGIVTALAGKPKAFFEAHVEGTLLHLDAGPLPDPGW